MIDLVHVISDTGIGGAGRYLLALLPGARCHGWQVTVLAPKGPLNAALQDTGLCRVIDLPQGEVSFTIPLWSWLVKHLPRQADLVHTHASLAARLAAKQLGLPIVMTRHTLGPELPVGGVPTWKRLIQGAVADHLTQGIIAVSAACRQRLIAEGVSQQLISLVYHGVDAQAFMEAKGDGWRRQWQVPKQLPVIVTTARLTSVKGLGTALSAAAKLQAAGHQFLWLLVGEGPERQQLQQQIDDLNLGGCVRLLGFQTDISGILAAADLFVLPSLQEALGLSVLEAMAAGLPVVASGVGGIPELISSGDDGLLVPAAEPKQLAVGIARLLQDPELRRQWGEQAREKILRQFTLQEMWRRTDLVYRSALGRKGAKR
jgi:glycosyltransferase involved in cell wall biosynthesis